MGRYECPQCRRVKIVLDEARSPKCLRCETVMVAAPAAPATQVRKSRRVRAPAAPPAAAPV